MWLEIMYFAHENKRRGMLKHALGLSGGMVVFLVKPAPKAYGCMLHVEGLLGRWSRLGLGALKRSLSSDGF